MKDLTISDIFIHKLGVRVQFTTFLVQFWRPLLSNILHPLSNKVQTQDDFGFLGQYFGQKRIRLNQLAFFINSVCVF